MESVETVIPPTETPVAETLATEAVATETVAANEAAALRSEWAERIRAEARLPSGLRERLASAVAESASGFTAGQEPSLTVSQVANLFAAALPSFLNSVPQIVAHPQGERFFQGEGVSNDEAAAIARQQLERTGFQRA